MTIAFQIFLAIAAAAPSSYKPENKAPSYPAPAYPAPVYPIPRYNKDNKYADITITSQSDERNLHGSSQWSFTQSQVQKKMQGVTYDSYGKESYGQKFPLTWIADDAGFQPKGDHLPVAPVHVYELPVAPVHEYELPVAPALPYARTGLGY
ncbi:pupal cuticle protein Edg-78E-like [Daphnia carinata]|uniref:pupal cuticle protein Edg-78E-like n=1 Tax=Daphnia carinata TaxID=120202 RepID=UPI0028683CE3|nr:pupal cuticle protein Edg-78E-like [Daphnia carinata]